MISNPRLRAFATPLAVLTLGLIAIAAITLLQSRASASRDAQLKLATVKIELNRLQTAPFQAHASTGGSPAVARTLMRTGKRRIATTLGALERNSPPAPLHEVARPLRADYAALDRIYVLGASKVGYGKEADGLAAVAGKAAGATSGLLDAASLEYDRRASRSQMQATVGSVVLILLLLGAFGFLYRRSAIARSLAECLVEENARLLALSREEALHDSLTGLPNRRALMNDLSAALPHANDAKPLVLALFDLDGFMPSSSTASS